MASAWDITTADLMGAAMAVNYADFELENTVMPPFGTSTFRFPAEHVRERLWFHGIEFWRSSMRA